MIGPIELEAAAPGLVEQVRQIFSPDGLLSKASNFEYRPQQQQMAVAVAEALETRGHLAVEAGTGVGKSLAYLIPAILFAVARKKKAVVSTHTINLQEQLVGKDLPMLEQILPVRFTHAMLKGRANYLCSRRLWKAMQQADSLFTSTETSELHRIYEWSQTTTGGSLSDFEVEPDSKVWAQVCSERGMCSPKICGFQSDFGRDHGVCFFQRARNRILSSDVIVLNHTLFFTLLGGVDEEMEGGILFKNDFVVFDEAHTLEEVASKHIGLSVSSGQLRWALHRLWNPRTEKGLLATLRRGKEVGLVADLIQEGDRFFEQVESACEEIRKAGVVRAAPGEGDGPQRAWTELRVRRPELAADTLSLPIQRLRESVSEMIKSSDDKDTGQELVECNRRLAELRDELGAFLAQSQAEYVYWVERSGRAQQSLSLNAAPIDVADYLRRRLFQSDTSVIATSATLAVSGAPLPAASEPARSRGATEGRSPARTAAAPAQGMDYFARRVGAEDAVLLQVGSPFDYERQMKLYVVNKMPDPRDAGYRDALVQWIEHFIRLTHGKAFVLFTNTRLMREIAERMAPVFDRLAVACFVQGAGAPRSVLLEQFKEDVNSVLFGTDSFWQGVDVPGEVAEQCHHHAPALCRAGSSADRGAH